METPPLQPNEDLPDNEQQVPVVEGQLELDIRTQAEIDAEAHNLDTMVAGIENPESMGISEIQKVLGVSRNEAQELRTGRKMPVLKDEALARIAQREQDEANNEAQKSQDEADRQTAAEREARDAEREKQAAAWLAEREAYRAKKQEDQASLEQQQEAVRQEAEAKEAAIQGKFRSLVFKSGGQNAIDEDAKRGGTIAADLRTQAEELYAAENPTKPEAEPEATTPVATTEAAGASAVTEPAPLEGIIIPPTTNPQRGARSPEEAYARFVQRRNNADAGGTNGAPYEGARNDSSSYEEDGEDLPPYTNDGANNLTDAAESEEEQEQERASSGRDAARLELAMNAQHEAQQAADAAEAEEATEEATRQRAAQATADGNSQDDTPATDNLSRTMTLAELRALPDGPDGRPNVWNTPAPTAERPEPTTRRGQVARRIGRFLTPEPSRAEPEATNNNDQNTQDTVAPIVPGIGGSATPPVVIRPEASTRNRARTLAQRAGDYLNGGSWNGPDATDNSDAAVYQRRLEQERQKRTESHTPVSERMRRAGRFIVNATRTPREKNPPIVLREVNRQTAIVGAPEPNPTAPDEEIALAKKYELLK